jgi:hypothetical protein
MGKDLHSVLAYMTIEEYEASQRPGERCVSGSLSHQWGAVHRHVGQPGHARRRPTKEFADYLRLMTRHLT